MQTFLFNSTLSNFRYLRRSDPFFLFSIMNSQIIKYWWIVNEYVYNIGVVQLWGKEICVDWSGTDRVQPKSIGSKQSRWENLCEESEWRKRNIQ